MEIDKDSKLIFFSDLHRGNDSISDEFARNQMMFIAALEYYNRNGYTYIEVGDGDDLWENKHFKHIRMAHSDVFTTIKKFQEDDRFIMMIGNHNLELHKQEFVKDNYYYFYDEYKGEEEKLLYGLKPVEGLRLTYKETGQDILVVHGHQGDFINDQLWLVSMVAVRFFWKYVHLVGFKNPASPAKNQFKRHKIEKMYNNWIDKFKVMLICGHTHRMKFPHKGQLPYFNCGCGIHSKGITGIEIHDGKIMLVQWRIKAGEDGKLVVMRSVIRGPEPIKKYDIRKTPKL